MHKAFIYASYGWEGISFIDLKTKVEAIIFARFSGTNTGDIDLDDGK